MGGYLGEILIQWRDKLRRLLELMVHLAFDEAVCRSIRIWCVWPSISGLVEPVPVRSLKSEKESYL
jgi:hypothetical protein